MAISRDDLTLQARLVVAMRDAVLDGDLAPGQHLKEREMCEMFQVSRPLVREAVRTLSAEELIDVIPHRGPVVSTIDRKSARELYAVRAALEGLACEAFATNADEKTRDELVKIFNGLSSLTQKTPPRTLLAAKNDFYRCLMLGSDNDVLAQILTRLNNRTVQLRRSVIVEKRPPARHVE